MNTRKPMSIEAKRVAACEASARYRATAKGRAYAQLGDNAQGLRLALDYLERADA